MMTSYQIRHITDYQYEDAASLSYNEAHLLPRTTKTVLYDQKVTDAQIQIVPGWNDYRERLDYYGNRVIYYTVRQPHEHIVITASSRVQVKARTYSVSDNHEDDIDEQQTETNGQPMATWLREHAEESTEWEAIVQQLRQDISPPMLEARQFCLPSPYIPVLDSVTQLARQHFLPGRPVVEAVLSLMEAIFNDFEFVANATDVATPISEVMRKRQGVCQDFAQLMISAMRSQGLSARYMSGYIETVPPPGEEKLEGTDASHAWSSLYAPGLGWIDFDPTNNLIPTDQHVVLGWGRDFGDVTPVKGVYFGGSQHNLEVSVDMKREEIKTQ